MARPKNISAEVETAYSKDVSPIWAKPQLSNPGGLFDKIRPYLNTPTHPEIMLRTSDGRKELKQSIGKALVAAGYSASRISEICIEDVHLDFHEASKELAHWLPGDGTVDGYVRHPSNIFLIVRCALEQACWAWRNYNWARLESEHCTIAKRIKAARKISEAVGEKYLRCLSGATALDSY